MKNGNPCPKCRRADILRVEGDVRAYGAGNNIIVGIFSTVKVHRYLCCRCGYSEEWIDLEDIDALKQKFR